MRSHSRARTLAIRGALTLACLAAFGVSSPATRTAEAQTVRGCTNTGCEGVDRCYFYASVNCAMTQASCTNTGCG
jgi:hypothetical protein